MIEIILVAFLLHCFFDSLLTRELLKDILKALKERERK